MHARMYSLKVILLFSQRVLYDQGCQHSVGSAGRGNDRKVGEASGPAIKGGEDKKRKRQTKKHKNNQ